jgi:uncharacterized membrane protein YphA (DoxX/SURF4 family)
MLVELIENPIFISVFLLSMFFVSGINKIFSFQETVDSLTNKVPFSTLVNTLALVLVILLEIIAPLLVIYYFITGNYKKYAYYSVISLCIFTILATILYHPPKFLYKKSLGFWANMTLVGGLLLLAKCINQRDKITMI